MNRLSVLALLLLSAGVATAQMRQISGIVVDEQRRPEPGIRVVVERVDDTSANCCNAPAEYRSRSDGRFMFEVPAGIYAVAADPSPPRGLRRVRIDVRSGNALELELTLPEGPVPFVADDPPKAHLIRAGTPNGSGETTVTGSAGSVPGGTSVIVMALRTGIVASTPAAADGSFEANVRAPHGTWLMIKHDPIGTTHSQILSEARNGGEGSPAPLSGTFVRVADPPGPAGLAFGDEGLLIGHLWRVEGTIANARLRHGERLTAQVRFILDSPLAGSMEKIPFSAHLLVERLSGDGLLSAGARSVFTSSLMTATGFPIEKGEHHDQAGGFARFETNRVSATRAEANFEISMPVAEALPHGHYRAAMRFFFETKVSPGERLQRITTDKPGRQPENFAWLPMVVIGEPPSPRLPVMLFADEISNATQGIRAIEDYDSFGLASRVALQSDRFVIPRTAVATGAPIRYRIEPYLPSVSVGDRGVPPDPPQIPFRLPSGALTVRIEKPSGAVETVGPARFVQARTRTIVDRHGMALIPGGSGGMVSEPYQLSTMDPRFEIVFHEEGLHRVRVDMTVEDERGITWHGRGTYEIDVARRLWIDTATLPGTPFITGDRLHSGGVLYPPMAADVTIRVRFAPRSDPARLIDRTIGTRSNRYGAFTAPESFTFGEAGEYRVDFQVTARDSSGHAWAGTRTWGGVVADPTSAVLAHGQRGIDEVPEPRPQWFFRTQTSVSVGSSHVFFPFHSGDVAWMQRLDSVQPMITFQDPDGSVLRRIKPAVFCCGAGGFDGRAAVGETPLLIGRIDGLDGHIDPARNDLWGYSYRSVQRPFVRIREEISDDSCNGCYWRFREQYAAQAGVGRNGDLPNDFKFQFGGVVIRGPAIGEPVYAAYASLFVLVPDNDPLGGTRVFPPFQGNGGGPAGGPLFKLKGRDIDLFLHPTGIRPGTVLQRGDRASFAGYTAPTLPSRVEIVITSPSGVQRTIGGQSNALGYYYDPAHDFPVGEAGVWKAKVKVLFDGRTSAGQVTAPLPTGDVPGSREGEFYFYVVDRDAPAVELAPRPQFVRPADGPITFAITPPAGLSNVEVHYTTTMPGFILEEGRTNLLSYTYDAQRVARDFPNLDLHDPDGFAGADTITISFLVSGTDATGARKHLARQIVIQGEELQMPEQKPSFTPSRRRAVRP